MRAYIQCFGGFGANVVTLSDEFVANATTAFHTFVPYDSVRHAAFRPGDVHDGNGGFATPPLSKEHLDLARAIVDETLGGDKKRHADLDALAKDPKATVHDLPDFVRREVRGYPDNWQPDPDELRKASAAKAAK